MVAPNHALRSSVSAYYVPARNHYLVEIGTASSDGTIAFTTLSLNPEQAERLHKEIAHILARYPVIMEHPVAVAPRAEGGGA